MKKKKRKIKERRSDKVTTPSPPAIQLNSRQTAEVIVVHSNILGLAESVGAGIALPAKQDTKSKSHNMRKVEASGMVHASAHCQQVLLCDLVCLPHQPFPLPHCDLTYLHTAINRWVVTSASVISSTGLYPEVSPRTQWNSMTALPHVASVKTGIFWNGSNCQQPSASHTRGKHQPHHIMSTIAWTPSPQTSSATSSATHGGAIGSRETGRAKATHKSTGSLCPPSQRGPQTYRSSALPRGTRPSTEGRTARCEGAPPPHPRPLWRVAPTLADTP